MLQNGSGNPSSSASSPSSPAINVDNIPLNSSTLPSTSDPPGKSLTGTHAVEHNKKRRGGNSKLRGRDRRRELAHAHHHATILSGLPRFLRIVMASIFGCFLLTAMLLHASLESVEAEQEHHHRSGNVLLRVVRDLPRGILQKLRHKKGHDYSEPIVEEGTPIVEEEEKSQQEREKDAAYQEKIAKRQRLQALLQDKRDAARGIPVHNHHHKDGEPKSKRALFEQEFLPNDYDRLNSVVASLRVARPKSQDDLQYDLYNCGETPPPHYPQQWNLVKMLHAWNPDVTDIPKTIHQGLCVFDWNDEAQRDLVLKYRQLELPMVVTNHPEVLRASERWNSPNYLYEMIGPEPQRNEYSKTNHFMFWRTRHLAQLPDGWKPPTENVKLPFTEWLKRAKQLQSLSKAAKTKQQQQQQQAAGAKLPNLRAGGKGGGDLTNHERWYFRLNGAYQGTNSYLYDEFPFFLPTQQDDLFMVDPTDARGINCRLGMLGVIAEAHFDPSRNWVLVMGGQRRYILSHPSQCKGMQLYDKGHPSGRHSMMDWSQPPPVLGEESTSMWSKALGTDDFHPPDGANVTAFQLATANEVVLQAGDALYLPDSWMHFIVSLGISYQCNARSGQTNHYRQHVRECGFSVPAAPYQKLPPATRT